MTEKTSSRKYPQELTLNEIVAHLTPEHRIIIVGRYAGKTHFDKQYIDEIIIHYEPTNPKFAAQIAESVGRTCQASLLYHQAFEKLKITYTPADERVSYKTRELLELAKKANLESEIERWSEKLFNFYTQITPKDHFKDHLIDALALAEQEPSLSSKIPELKKQIHAKKLHDFGDYKRNREIYQAGTVDQRWWDALGLAKELGLHDEVLELYICKGYFVDAAQYAEKQDLPEKALDFYLQSARIESELNYKSSSYQSAIRVAKALGKDAQVDTLVKQLIKTYIRHSRDDKAAEIAAENGLYSMAIELYVDCGHFYSAIKTAQTVGLTERATELYAQAKERYLPASPESFVNIALKFGDDEDKAWAAQLLTKNMEDLLSKGVNTTCSCCIYQIESAAKIAEQLGLEERANVLFQLHDFVKENSK